MTALLSSLTKREVCNGTSGLLWRTCIVFSARLAGARRRTVTTGKAQSTLMVKSGLVYTTPVGLPTPVSTQNRFAPGPAGPVKPRGPVGPAGPRGPVGSAPGLKSPAPRLFTSEPVSELFFTSAPV